jgi:SAM-dependent methyltransferase
MLGPLKKYGKVYGIDASPLAIEFCKLNGFANTFVTDLKSFDETQLFDLICYFDVLEHLSNDHEAVEETYRRLKPGAYAVFTVPAFPFMWSGQDVVLKHYRRYTRDQLERLVGDRGFQILFSTYFNFFLFFPIVVFRIIENILGLNRKPVESDLMKSPKIFNGFLEKIFSSEKYFLRWIKFPVGVSLFCLVKKPNEQTKETK